MSSGECQFRSPMDASTYLLPRVRSSMTSTNHCRPKAWVCWLLAVMLAIPVLAAIVPSPAHSEARTVRVASNITGVSGNPPLIFTDESGRPVGIFVDIIQHVAAGQGWKLEWVPCIWAACPAMLAGGEIDLISALAYSDERARKFDFTLETVFSNWAVVLRAPGNEIHSITDLEGLRVATNRGSIHTRVLRLTLDSFNIQSDIVEVDGYADIARALQAGEVSAGIFNRLNASKFANRPGIEKTAVIFNPVELRFATAKGRNADLRDAIDQTMSALKADKSSAYYASLEKWLFAKDQRTVVPVWLWWVLGGGGSVLLMLFAFNQVLRARVKRATASLEEARDNLEEQVEERTRELSEEIEERVRLEAALVTAEKLKAVGRITGGVAHHFNNILNVILGNLEIVQHQMASDPRGQEHQCNELIEKAVAGGWRAADITKKLLLYSRERSLLPSVFDLNALIREREEALGKLLAPDIRVSRELADGLPMVNTDRAGLGDALLAMAENARDAMDGGGTLRLNTELVHLEGREKPGDGDLLDGDYVVLAVSDDGPGMTPEVVERAFDPFFTTADPTRAGLGLSIVYGLARQSGGLAVIESSEGQGTTVKLFLPEAGEQEAPAAMP